MSTNTYSPDAIVPFADVHLNRFDAHSRSQGPGAHLLQQDPAGNARLADVVDCIAETSKGISCRLRRFGLDNLQGTAGLKNSSGDEVIKMDQFAHEAIVSACRARSSVAMVASEESSEAEVFSRPFGDRGYDVYVDPLDGSSNTDVCVPVGTIFSIYESGGARLKRGRKQVAAGYMLYGSATMFVYTTGRGVHAFTLDPLTGCYVLSAANIRMPRFGRTYSVNQAYECSFQPEYRAYLNLLRSGLEGRSFGLRYVGSLVSDFHRTLWKGGVFLYPGSKLRLMYEANPLAWIAEEAGGMASDGTQPILDIEPTEGIHQRTPLLFGSANEMLAFQNIAERYRNDRVGSTL